MPKKELDEVQKTLQDAITITGMAKILARVIKMTPVEYEEFLDLMTKLREVYATHPL